MVLATCHENHGGGCGGVGDVGGGGAVSDELWLRGWADISPDYKLSW